MIGRRFAGLRDGLRKVSISGTTLIFTTTVYIALTQNTALWRLALDHLPQPLDLGGVVLLSILGLILAAGTFTVAAVLCVGPLLRIGLVVLLVIAVTCNYFMSRYGVLIDVQMLVNTSRTNLREARELISAALILRLLLFAAIPALLLFVVRIRPAKPLPEAIRRCLIAILLWAMAVGVLAGNYREAALWARENAEIIKYPNPVFPLISAYKFARGSLISPASAAELKRVAQHVAPRSEPHRRVVILVVGETARADHFSLYGYGRETNPELKRVPSLLRFADVRSCGTSTAVSVPCMFSRLGRDEFDRKEAETSENLLDVLTRAEVSVLWRENNTGCQGVCPRVTTEDLASADDARFCADGSCRDEILLDGLRERIVAGKGDQLIVLHQLGSHGPSYYKRYPASFARFQPECALDDAYRCERDGLINSYDNTVLYTDHVIAETIRMLGSLRDSADTAMIYVSDHGESLGENGMYLHGFPYAFAPEEQTRIPMLAWLSPDLMSRKKLDLECLASQTGRALSHDHLFDIVLGLFDVQSDVYRPGSDVLSPCGQSTRAAEPADQTLPS